MGQAAPAAEGAPLKLFVNYRHQDAQGTAWGVYWPLEARFGRDNVFFDNGKLRAGEEWSTEITLALQAADVLIVLIGSAWLDMMTERLRRPGKDYVAYEIETGLLRRPAMTVIPVLVDDTPIPDARVLPPSLQGLVACQGERVHHAKLREDVEQLINRMTEVGARVGRVLPPPPDRTPPLPAAPAELAGPEPANVIALSERVGAQEQFAVAPEPDEQHYDEVVEEARDTGIVAFLGAAVNAEDSQTLPDDEMLARYLSAKVKLQPESCDLAEVAQYARALRGEQRVFQLLREGLPVAPEPGHVQRYLAGLPKRLEQLNLQKRYQMIVTPKYDAALERAFREQNEPFDVVIYMGPGSDAPGKFVHIPWDRPAVTIAVPNEYRELPIRRDMELERTLIVRTNGSADDPDVNYTWKDNYVVTEDHYIQYLSGSPLSGLIPGQIIEKLKSASYLFLGYTMADWRLRVFLKRLWPGERLGNGTHWAVERAPTRLEEKLCFAAGVKLYQSSLADYVDGLDEFLQASSRAQATP
jgi:hypothetical protein